MTNLALGEAMASIVDTGPPAFDPNANGYAPDRPAAPVMAEGGRGQAHAATIRLIEPVDLYTVGLLTAYSAAVLGSWRRAGFIGALLMGLYALLYVLLSLEAFALLTGAVLMFLALAGPQHRLERGARRRRESSSRLSSVDTR